MKKRTLYLLLFILPAMACQLFTGAEGTAVPPTSDTIIIPTALNPPPTLNATQTVTPETAVSATATPTITPTPCTYATVYLADVTIPDDTELAPGTAFTKTWLIRNSGNCTLPDGTIWAYADGERMNGAASNPMPNLAPNATAEISVDLIAPQTPGTYTGYWQVKLPNGVTLPTRYFVRIIVPAATPTPTATTPALTAPTITYFRSSINMPDPGDTIQLEWDTTNSEQVTIYRIYGGQLGTFWTLEPTGVMSYTINASERNTISFALYASRAGYDGYAQDTLEIPLTCPNEWFFTPAPDECAAQDTLISAGAEQPFEHGVMIWVQELDRIYVLYDDEGNGEWNAFTDEWDPGEPENDPSINPPPGLYQPQRGFGLVWREQPDMQTRLGWATAPETSFTTAYQTTARFKYNETFLQALDGGVCHLLPERSAWEKLGN